MNGQPVVAVVGSFMMDLVIRTERRPNPGETVIGQSFGIFPGGKGLNQAVTARRMGARVFMVGRVGADAFGDQFLRTLEAEGICTEYVVRDPEHGTGVGNPVLDGQGQNAIIIVPQANLHVTPSDVDRAHAALESADVIVLQNEISHAASVRAARLGRELGKTVIYNPAPAKTGVDALLSLADTVTPNESEMEALTGLRPVDTDSAVRAARELMRRGPRIVVVTMGDKGAVAVTESGVLALPPYPVEVVDTTGAGDAFNGGLAYALAAGLSLSDAVKVANTAGALAVTRLGAVPSMPSQSQVLAFWRARGVEPCALG
jgi:ribokinase